MEEANALPAGSTVVSGSGATDCAATNGPAAVITAPNRGVSNAEISANLFGASSNGAPQPTHTFGAVNTAPNGSQPNLAAHSSTTIVVPNSSAQRANYCDTMCMVPPLPTGPIGPRPRRMCDKLKLYKIQQALSLELGVLNSLCDTEFEDPELAELDEQYQAEMLRDYRDRVSAHLKTMEGALRSVAESLDQGQAIIDNAFEDDRPELEAFMEEFSVENHLHEHQLVGQRLINRFKKDLHAVGEGLAKLRARECSALSMQRTTHSELDPATQSRRAASTASGSPSEQGFAHSTPVMEPSRAVNTARNDGDTRSRDQPPEFNSSAINAEENARIMHDHANEFEGGVHRPEPILRGGLYRENERGSIELLDGDHRPEDDLRIERREHDGRHGRDGAREAEISASRLHTERPVGADRHGHFDRSVSPHYRGYSRSRDNPNGKPLPRRVHWDAETKVEEYSPTPVAEDSPAVPPGRPPASGPPSVPPRSSAPRGPPPAPSGRPPASAAAPYTAPPGRPPASGYDPGGPGAGGARGYGPTSGPPPAVSSSASATYFRPNVNPDQGGLYVATATNVGTVNHHNAPAQAHNGGGVNTPTVQMYPSGYPGGVTPPPGFGYSTPRHDHAGGTVGYGVITPRPPSAAFNNGFYQDSPVFPQAQNSVITLQPSALELTAYKKNFCPEFSGDLKKWPVFRDRFIQLVERANPPLADGQKLQVLVDHLKGIPYEMCQHLPLTDENYDVATSMLNKRYGVPSYLESELIIQLKGLPRPENTVVSLEAFHDKSFALAHQLYQTGANLEARSELTRLWLAKLPPKLVEERICDRIPKEERSFFRVLEALQDIIGLKREVDTDIRPWGISDPRPQNNRTNKFEGNRNNSGYQHRNRHDRGQVNAANAERKAESKAPAARKSPYCALCPANDHWPTECSSYPDPETRWARVKAMDICQCCLRKEQWSGQCARHTNVCKFCNRGRHHMSLCKRYTADRPRNEQRQNRSPPPNGGKDRKPRPGRKVRFERGSQRETRKMHASISESADQPSTNAGRESEEEGSFLYDDYMGSLKPEDCPNYTYRPIVSPIPDFDSEPEPEFSDYSESSDSDQSSDEGSEGAAYGSVVLNRTNGHETACLLECARTQLFNPVTGKIEETNVFFDGGSTHSYVHSSLAERLSLPKLSKSSLIVNTFGRDEPIKMCGFDTRIGFRPKNGKPLVLDVTTSDHVTSNMEAVFISAKDLPALKADKCAIVPSEQKVEVLIGRRDFHLFKRRESERLPCGFEIVKTTLGPILAGHGYVGTTQSDPTARTCFATAKAKEAEDPLHKVADAFWHIERTGMESSKPHADDEMVYERVRAETIINEDGRYEVPLVFKTPTGEPPSNLELPQQKQASIGRLESELRKLHKSPKILGSYKEYLEGLIARKEAEIIPPEEIKTPNTSHYLAHHDVVKETSSTTKVRPVHDASAHPKGRPSLNDKLHRGPVLLPKIVGCLLRSRFARMVILSDIAKAFLQVSVKPSHRDLLRWFWVKDVSKPVSIENLLHVRFTRVPFGLKISPFLLAAVLEQHFQKYDSPVAREMLRNCYVDNVMLTAETVSEALQKYRESKQICADAKMQLREFVSNSIEFNESIPVEDRADTGNLKNLGIPWQCIVDDWVISLHPKDAHPSMTYGTEVADQPSRERDMRGSPLTRRKMLSQMMAVYDPCGLTNPLMVAAKLVVQKVWEGKPAWDQAVPEPMVEAWKEATADFSTTEIRIPRRVCDGPIAEARLHVFCDASADAYGFCTYLVCRSANVKWHSNLLFSRNNVKPLGQANSLTIPRMEMMGLLKGSTNIPFIVEELGFPVQGIFLWSDSMIAIHQVLSPEKTQETWLENRLKQIRQICRTHNVTVGHVRTDENPADHTSRGMRARELQNCNLWWHGPEWLRKDPSEFPPQPETIQVAFKSWLDQASEENAQPSDDGNAVMTTAAAIAARPNPPYIPPKHAIACFGNIARINSASAPADIPPDNLLPEDQMSRCQTWQKLRRVHATVFRACAIFMRCGRVAADPRPANYLGADLRDHFRETYSKRSKVQHFTVPELGLVESFLVRKAQAQNPPTVYDRKLLEIFSDGHFLRVRGRIAESGLPESAHSPIYLSRNNSLIKLLILHYHVANVHANVGTTLANVRLHYWFTHGRRTVQSVIRSMCFECQRLINPAFKAPPAPQLPEERVKPSRPFKAVGIDFFGPKLLRSTDHNGKTETKKFWVCIFVCTWSRACHLELCSDLSTEEFLHAFQRFCGRRGSPSHILSDNGSTFLSGREVLRKIHTVQSGGKSATADKQPPADTRAPVVVQRPTRSTRGIAAQRFDPTPIPVRRVKNKRPLAHTPPAEETLRPQQAAYVPSRPHPDPSIDGEWDAERSQQATGPPAQEDPSGGAGELSPSSTCAAVITAEEGKVNVRKADGNPLNNGLHNQGPEISVSLRPPADQRVGVNTVSADAAPLSVITEHACHSRRSCQKRSKISNDRSKADELWTQLSERGALWRTITPRASWFGGSYERIIGLVKHCLARALGRSVPRVEDFHSLLARAEWTINSRPLTYVSNSEYDFVLVRPVDFLIPHLQFESSIELFGAPYDDDPDPDYVAPDEHKQHVRIISNLQHLTRLTDKFWKLFQEGVLLELRRDHGKKGKNTPVREIQPGDVVLVYEEDIPRAQWRPALVTGLVQSKDGSVRTANIRLPSGCETARSVTHLYPLGPPVQVPLRG